MEESNEGTIPDSGLWSERRRERLEKQQQQQPQSGIVGDAHETERRGGGRGRGRR
jgi:hypothetical protein